MNIISVNGNQKLIDSTMKLDSSNTSATELTSQFSDYLNDAIHSLNSQHHQVEQLREKFVSGEITDPHTVMIAAEELSLGLELTVQVRNKAIEAYQELMRMQI